MPGWTVVVCPPPGRSTRRYRLGPLALTLLAIVAVSGLCLASAVGWAVGEYQARAVLSGAASD